MGVHHLRNGRLFATMAAAVLAMFAAAGARADDAEVEQVPEVKLRYDDGFQLVTTDGRFSLKLNGAIQFRYTFVDFDDAIEGNEENYSNFYMRRARVWWRGHVFDPKVTYFIHLQLEPHRLVNSHDVYLEYELGDLVRVGLGRNKVAYGLEFLNSGFGLNLVERSVMYGETDIDIGGGAALYPGGGTALLRLYWTADTGFATGGLSLYRSQGVWLRGRRGSANTPTFEYNLGIWQGRGSMGLSNRDDDHLYTVRAAFYPWGWIDWSRQGDGWPTDHFKLGFTGSAYRQSKKVGGGFTESGYNMAVETRYRGLSVDAEWGTESFDYDAFDDDFDRTGWRLVAGYFVLPQKLELAARYAEIQRLVDPSYQAALDSGLGVARVLDDGAYVIGLEDRISELTVGASYYFNDWHRHKLQVDLSRLVREFAADPDAGIGRAPDQVDLRLRAMVQLFF